MAILRLYIMSQQTSRQQQSNTKGESIFMNDCKENVTLTPGGGGGCCMVIEEVSGTQVDIDAEERHVYICGEILSLDFTPSEEGICEVIFKSGTTPTALTLPQTVMMPDWFVVEANKTYEISILEGKYGAVMSWS